MPAIVVMRRVDRKKQAYTGRAIVDGDRMMVLNAAGNVLYNGSRKLWAMLVSLGLAAGATETRQ
jgi:hypothetical protein